MGAELRRPGLRQWIEEMGDTSALIGAVTAVTNPSMFQAGMDCIKAIATNPERVAKREHLDELLHIWTSPFPTVSLMNNRNSPLHRDNGGGYSYMDILLSVGDYRDGHFYVPGVGGDLSYCAGNVIGLCGCIVQHGATAVGERFVFAQYLRETVLKSLGIPDPDWVYIQDFENACTQ